MDIESEAPITAALANHTHIYTGNNFFCREYLLKLNLVP